MDVRRLGQGAWTRRAVQGCAIHRPLRIWIGPGARSAQNSIGTVPAQGSTARVLGIPVTEAVG